MTPATSPTVDGHRRGVRQATRQDGDRRERRSGLLHDAHAVGVHERGGPAARRRRGDRRDRPRRWWTSASRSVRSRCSTKSASTSADKVGVVLAEAFGARMTPSEAMRRVVQAGRTGRKGGKGFYRYDADGKEGRGRPERLRGDRRRAPRDRQPSRSRERCVLAMVNEAARCLEEGILRSPRDGDIGAVFGIGFPPFRGGPFRYIDSVGADRIVEQLEDLNVRFARRFEPAEASDRHGSGRTELLPAGSRDVIEAAAEHSLVLRPARKCLSLPLTSLNCDSLRPP